MHEFVQEGGWEGEINISLCKNNNDNNNIDKKEKQISIHTKERDITQVHQMKTIIKKWRE